MTLTVHMQEIGGDKKAKLSAFKPSHEHKPEPTSHPILLLPMRVRILVLEEKVEVGVDMVGAPKRLEWAWLDRYPIISRVSLVT